MIFNNLKYNFDWETVVCGFWNRFPSRYHPHINNVYTIDTNIMPEEKRLIVQRLYHITYTGPYMIQKIIGNNVDYFILEESTVDLKSRTLTYNLQTVAPDFYRYTEIGSYQSSGDDKLTKFQCSSDVKFNGFGPMNYTLERLAHSSMNESIKKSNEFNAMIDSITSLNV